MLRPPGKTEGWQPIDRGHIGATLKALARQNQDAWLSIQENFEKWENNSLTASDTLQDNASAKRTFHSDLSWDMRTPVLVSHPRPLAKTRSIREGSLALAWALCNA